MFFPALSPGGDLMLVTCGCGNGPNPGHREAGGQQSYLDLLAPASRYPLVSNMHPESLSQSHLGNEGQQSAS